MGQRQGGGVGDKNVKNVRDVIYGWPLSLSGSSATRSHAAAAADPLSLNFSFLALWRRGAGPHRLRLPESDSLSLSSAGRTHGRGRALI